MVEPTSGPLAGQILAVLAFVGIAAVIVREYLMSLIPHDPDTCPACGHTTVVETVDQPALLRHGGYGATRSHTIRSCPACPWWLDHQTQEVRP